MTAAELGAHCLGLLRARGESLATAESLTAGLISATLAGAPGASDVLRGGIAAYATDVKVTALDVGQALIDDHGAVSAECAAAMARGARALFGAHWAVAATGVAGPDQQEGKPVGTVFLAVAGPDGVRTEHVSLDGGRQEIREGCVERVLDLLQTTVTGTG